MKFKENPFLTMILGSIVGNYLAPLPKKIIDAGIALLSDKFVISNNNEDYKYYELLVTRSCRIRSFSMDYRIKCIGAGTYWFWLGKSFVTVTKTIDKSVHTLTFIAHLGSLEQVHIEHENIKAAEVSRKEDCDFIETYDCPTDDFGERQRYKRPLETVYMNKELKDQIVDTVGKFIKDVKWYHRMGIPHKLVILLEGPPGTGKSSLIKGLTAHFNMNLNRLILSGKGFSDRDLSSLLNNKAYLGNLLVIEDVDRAFTDNKDLTPSGLLNALDGATSPDSMIMVMTTNHLEVLDEALTRKGRIDKIFHIGRAESQQLREYFYNFFVDTPGHTNSTIEILASSFADKVGDKKVVMAEVQAHLMNYRNAPVEALEECIGEA